MGNNGMIFLFSVILAGICIYIDAYECCSDQNNKPAVFFCNNSTAENQSIVYISNERSPKMQKNNCTCTITPLTLQGQVSVQWTHASDQTANIMFVLQNRNVKTLTTSTTIGISIDDVTHVIYQTTDSDNKTPFCLVLQASDGTFSVSCARSERVDDTNTPNAKPTITDTSQASNIEQDINDTNTTSPSSSTTINTEDTIPNSAPKKALTKNKDDNMVLLGPVIGGVCAVIGITIVGIVIVVVVRRRKRDVKNPLQTSENITTENPIYDRDGSPNEEPNIQNHNTDNDDVHYNTVNPKNETVDEYGGPKTRSETKHHEYYSKVDKTTSPFKDNKRSHAPHIQDPTDHYDRTDVKRDIQPFNEYNHLSTVHRYSQDALGDYDRANINLGQINKGHDEDADTYNTAFSH